MEEDISSCLKVLQSGGTILYPTDTIWGIGCDATDYLAVEKVYALKKRTESKSLIILLDDPEKIKEYVTSVPAIAWDLLQHVETPLTIIYPAAKNLAGNVVAGDGSVAIRIIRTEFCKRLIRAFGKPIVSTSANIAGEDPPLTFRNISQEILRGVDYIADESLDQFGLLKPSRIIKLNPNGEFHIIRN